MPSANMPTRDAFLALFTVLTLLVGATGALAAGPAAPSGLRAEVYSRTAAELFWDRPDAFGLVYEVRRDGNVLVTTDGVSFFDDTLAGNSAYTYAVIAIDREGERSAPASVMLATRGGAPGGPPAPTGLRAEVYSGTAAELFWDRPDAFGLVYEVRRGGNLVTVTDGVSFFDDTLSGARAYVYDVVAIDREERRSAPSSVSLETPPGGGTPPRRPTPPPVPTGLRGEVYSATALELFWERPPASEDVVAFDLFRDGRYLRRVEGPSAFEEGLRPGTAYRYNVVAIRRSGIVSEPSRTLTLRTRDAPGGDVSGETGAVTADRLALRTTSSDAPGSAAVTTRYVYDETGFLVRIEQRQGLPENVFMSELLSYDSEGRRAERRTFIGEVGAPEGAFRLFTSRYDDRGRWIGEDVRTPPDAPISSRFVHDFDTADRIVSRETRGTDGTVGFRVSYAYDETGRLVGQENYDAQGQLVVRRIFDYVDGSDLLSTELVVDESGSEIARRTFVYETGPCDLRWLQSVNRYFCVPR